jgi:hypothetical protein
MLQTDGKKWHCKPSTPSTQSKAVFASYGTIAKPTTDSSTRRNSGTTS